MQSRNSYNPGDESLAIKNTGAGGLGNDYYPGRNAGTLVSDQPESQPSKFQPVKSRGSGAANGATCAGHASEPNPAPQFGDFLSTLGNRAFRHPLPGHALCHLQSAGTDRGIVVHAASQRQPADRADPCQP